MREKLEDVNFRNLVDIPSTTYATFALYRYPAKFIPHVIAYILENYAEPEADIFDPFAGYGTAGIVSRVYGHDYEMWDLNPLLEELHRVATADLREIDIDKLAEKISGSNREFKPDWPNCEYWYPEEFLPFLHRIWGFYHSMSNGYEKTLLTVPLLEASRHYSYDDPERMKFSKSPKSRKRVDSLRRQDWKEGLCARVKKNLKKVVQGLREYRDLSPEPVRCRVRGGVDTFSEELEGERDIIITSPPYMQSQEYMRQAKMDLFWLGYSIEEIRELKKMEIPYRDVEKQAIHSKTFARFRNEIKEDHMRKLFDNYFYGTLGSLTRLAEKINKYVFLFVGRASLRGKPVPIDRIFAEHFSSLDWTYVKTLIDQIDAQRMFSYGNNPATGIRDKRTDTENLVILRKK